MGDIADDIKIGNRVFYKSQDAFGHMTEKSGVVENVTDKKVYLGRRRWVSIEKIVRIQVVTANG